MARPNLSWKGSVESETGEATFVCGEASGTVSLISCADAMKIQKLLDKAYIDGAHDALSEVSNTIKSCKNKWLHA